MFKKVEIWILYLVMLINVFFSISFGILVRQELVGRHKLGIVSETALFLAEIPKNLRKIINSSPHLKKKDRFPDLDGFNGQTNLNKSYLLLSRYDGDLREGIVELIDLTNFKTLHVWNPDIDEFNKSIKKIDEFKYLSRDDNNFRKLLVHPKLTKDGGLLFGWFSPLRKIDACSNLVFENAQDQFHHSIETDIEENIWVSASLYPQELPKVQVGRKQLTQSGFRDDAIVKLSAEGRIIFKKSISEILNENGLGYLLFSSSSDTFEFDPIHLNDIQPLDFDSQYWKQGDLLLSLRNQSMILLYRPKTNKILWKGSGPFFSQHDVNVLNDNQISIFNNNARYYINGFDVHGHNQIVIYDFKSDTYKTYLNKSLIKYDVRTVSQGRGKILSNGDLFIEEHNSSRLLYFNKDGTLRWNFVNRANNGKLYSLGWSRILTTDKDLENVKNLLSAKAKCNV